MSSPPPTEREWTNDELALIEAKPAHWVRTHKLTPEQVKAIRLRVDSLTVPWTLAELAAEYGVEVERIARIARRHEWSERAYEPGGRRYWREEYEEELRRGSS